MFIKGADSYLSYGVEPSFGTAPAQLEMIDFGSETFRHDKAFQDFTPISEFSRGKQLLSSVSNISGSVNLPYGLGLVDDFWSVLLRSYWETNVITNRNIQSSLYLEKGNAELSYYTGYSGCVLDGLNISLDGGYATFDTDLLFKDEILDTQVNSSFGSVVDPTDLFTSVSGYLQIDGTTIGTISNFSLNINNNYRMLTGPSSSTANEFIAGDLIIGGSFSLYISDNTQYSKFINEDEFQLTVKLNELQNTSNYHIIDLSNVKISESGINFDKRSKTLNNITFKAIPSGSMINVTRSA